MGMQLSLFRSDYYFLIRLNKGANIKDFLNEYYLRSKIIVLK
jgi:hypothetical protein